MKLHPVFACAILVALSGCASVGDMFAADERPAAPVTSGFTPLAYAPLPSSFCRDTASSDRLRASLAGFDTATLDRFAAQSLRQCNVVWAGLGDARYERLASR